MILETERLILRPFEDSDAESVYEYAKSSQIGPMCGWEPHQSMEESRKVIRTILSAPETYAICPKDTGKAIGSIDIKMGKEHTLKLREDEGELGCWLGVPFWGQGIMPEAARELIRHAFLDLKLNTLWYRYFDGNEKSKRVQEKCGFTYVATRKNTKGSDPEHGTKVYVNRLTKEEWLKEISIRPLIDEEIPGALNLAWEVFLAYDALEYTEEGILTFQKCLVDREYLQGITYYGAFECGNLVGMAGIRQGNAHLCFFFVDGRYHRSGIGERLFLHIQREYEGKEITVNSSPYGVPFYLHLGFEKAGGEQTIDGIRFIPMILKEKSIE